MLQKQYFKNYFVKLVIMNELCIHRSIHGASLVTHMVKNLPAMWQTQAQSLDWEDSLEKEMATHSSTLVWKIPWTEEPGGLQSTRSPKVPNMTE